MNVRILQGGDINITNTFKPKSCPTQPESFNTGQGTASHVCFVDLLTQIQADRPRDVPLRGVIVWQRVLGQRDGGFSATQGLSEASVNMPCGWNPLTLHRLVSQEQQWHRLFKAFYCKQENQSKNEHSRDACFPCGWYSCSHGVVFHLHLQPHKHAIRMRLVAAIWGQTQQQRHDDMFCSTELKLGVSQAVPLNQTSNLTSIFLQFMISCPPPCLSTMQGGGHNIMSTCAI